MKLSIRWRLTAWYAAVVLAALTLFGCGSWFALKARLEAGVDARLDLRLRGMLVSLSGDRDLTTRDRLRHELEEGVADVPDGTVIQLRDKAGRLVISAPDAPPVDGAGGRYRTVKGTLDAAGERFELLLAGPLDEVHGVLQVFRNLLLLAIPLVLAVSSMGGYWLSGRALRPVDRITRAAQSISLQNLSQRIEVPSTGDELQRMAETWNEVLARLDGAVQRIRQFTADASHELRTPLALIRGTAELALRRDRDGEEYRRFLHDIEDEAARMTALTEALLAMARTDAGGLEIVRARADVGALVRSAVGQSAAVAEEKGIRLEEKVSDAPLPAMVDDQALRRVLLILLDNALKYTAPGGTVTASAEWLADGAEIAVVDTGDGIAADELPHIFERFYRADAARGNGGFGLGLSIAQAIAQAHGSRIEVKSAPGAGSRFSLRLKN